MSFSESLSAMSPASVPVHVALIMDGNGRWALARGLERVHGHVQGAESVKACMTAAMKAGVKWLTLYAFSTENWGRPAEEVDALMELFCENVVEQTDELVARGVRVKVIGARAGLSEKVRAHIGMVESATGGGDKLTVVLALNYSSRGEIVRAAAQIVREAMEWEGSTQGDKLAPVMVTERVLSEKLDTAGMPDPDLIIRTGGEMRLSNFLLWQSAYAELYFTPVMWPDFDEDQFNEALAEYARRERRFGRIDN